MNRPIKHTSYAYTSNHDEPLKSAHQPRRGRPFQVLLQREEHRRALQAANGGVDSVPTVMLTMPLSGGLIGG